MKSLREQMTPAIDLLLRAAIEGEDVKLGDLLAGGLPRDLLEAIVPDGTVIEDHSALSARDLTRRLMRLGDLVRRAHTNGQGLH